MVGPGGEGTLTTGGFLAHAARSGRVRRSGCSWPRYVQEVATHSRAGPPPDICHVRQLGGLALIARKARRDRGDPARGLRVADSSAQRRARSGTDLGKQSCLLALAVRPTGGGEAGSQRTLGPVSANAWSDSRGYAECASRYPYDWSRNAISDMLSFFAMGHEPPTSLVTALLALQQDHPISDSCSFPHKCSNLTRHVTHLTSVGIDSGAGPGLQWG